MDNQKKEDFTDIDLKTLCCYCFDVLLHKLSKKNYEVEFPTLFLQVNF